MENTNVPQAPVQGQAVVVVKNNFWKGFFLGALALLLLVGIVVVIIVFILSSVVNTSLDEARAKGAFSTVKALLATTRGHAEVYYDMNGTNGFTGVCESDLSVSGTLISLRAMTNVSDVKCFSDKDSYAITAVAKVGDDVQTMCVDSNGFLKTTTGNNPATSADYRCQ